MQTEIEQHETVRLQLQAELEKVAAQLTASQARELEKLKSLKELTFFLLAALAIDKEDVSEFKPLARKIMSEMKETGGSKEVWEAVRKAVAVIEAGSETKE